MADPAIRHHRLRNAWPTLAHSGIAVQHFPAFNPGRPQASAAGPFNTHDVLYLSFIVAGRAWHDIGDSAFAEGPGSLSVVNYGVPHRISTEPEGVDVYNIYLDPQRHPLPTLPADLTRAVYAFLPLHGGLGHRRNRLMRVTFDDSTAVADRLARMEREQQAGAAGSLTVMQAELQVLLVHLGRRLLDAGWREPSDDDPLMAQACERMVGRLTEPLSLEDLARECGLSRHYLCRRFKRYTGLTVMQYAIQRRLQEACLRLRSGDESVLSIALDCGFNDVSYFDRRFRQALGITPSRYRARCRS